MRSLKFRQNALHRPRRPQIQYQQPFAARWIALYHYSWKDVDDLEEAGDPIHTLREKERLETRLQELETHIQMYRQFLQKNHPEWTEKEIEDWVMASADAKKK